MRATEHALLMLCSGQLLVTEIVNQNSVIQSIRPTSAFSDEMVLFGGFIIEEAFSTQRAAALLA